MFDGRAGIGIRRPHYSVLPSCTRQLDILEFVPENFVGVGGRAARCLDACAERWPLLAHGVSANIGGPDPLDGAYLAELKALLDRLRVARYSDHLCLSAIHGRVFHDLIPVPFSDEAVRHIGARIRELGDRLERTIVLENISAYTRMPGGHLDEGAFTRAVLEEGDAALLLDVNNVYVNAANHREDPLTLLQSLPLERTVHIHMAGHTEDQGRLLDSHGTPVCDDVWNLFQSALDQIGSAAPVIVEWDTHIPGLDRVLDEADKARALMERTVRCSREVGSQEADPRAKAD